MSLSNPRDVAIAAPLMLGYWPSGSLCAVFVDDDDRVLLIMRWDEGADVALPPLPWSMTGETPPRACHLVAYAAEADLGRADVKATVDALRASGVSSRWVLRVTTDGGNVRWTSALGPQEGLGTGVISHPQALARARRWGRGPWRSSRSDYVADIEPDPQGCERVAIALSRRAPAVDGAREDVIAHLRGILARDRLEPEAVADVLVGLADPLVRDTLLWDVMHERPRVWVRVADRLAEVVTVAPDTHVAPPATLLGILRWQTGDGSRASAAIERALDADAAYALAGLMDRCLATGMHPTIWRDGLASLSRAECLRAV